MASSGRSRHEPVDSSAERTRRYRARLAKAGAKRAENPPCRDCGRVVQLAQIKPGSPRDLSSLGRTLCAPCWRKSPDGRAAEAGRKRRTRAEQADSQGSERGENPVTT